MHGYSSLMAGRLSTPRPASSRLPTTAGSGDHPGHDEPGHHAMRAQLARLGMACLGHRMRHVRRRPAALWH